MPTEAPVLLVALFHNMTFNPAVLSTDTLHTHTSADTLRVKA